MLSLNDVTCIFIKNFNTEGEIVKKADCPHSYIIDTPRGVISRKRRHTVKLSKHVEVNEPSDLTSGTEIQNSKMPLNQPDCFDKKEYDIPLTQKMQISHEKSNNVYVTQSSRISKLTFWFEEC